MNRLLANIILILLPALLLQSAVAADYIVSQGKLQDGEIYYAENWQEGPGELVGFGTDRYVISKYSYEAAEFHVTAEISLDVHNSTAVTFCLGKYALGLDGAGEFPYFFEVQGGAVQRYSSEHIYTPKQFFQFEAIGKNGEVRFLLDGQEAVKVSIDTGKPLSFGFRPQRNTIRIRNFSIEGRNCGINTLRMEQLKNIHGTIPVITEFLSTGENATITLRSENTPVNGNFTVSFLAEDGSKISNELPVDVREAGLTLQAELLQQLWEKTAGTGALRVAELALHALDGQEILRNRLILYSPSHLTGLPTGRIAQDHGYPCFTLDGEKRQTISGRMGRAYWSQFNGRAVRQFAEAGIHDNIIVLFPRNYLTSAPDYPMNYDAILADIREFAARTLAEDPQARFILYYELLMPSSFVDFHPDEVIRLDNGLETLNYGPDGKLQPSYASQTWRQVMGKHLSEFVRRLDMDPLAERISGLKLLYANCGEWNHWGYHENAFVDMSQPMQRAFGDYLRSKYGTSEKLQDAWHRKDISFDSGNLVPERDIRLAGGEMRLGQPELQQVVDYYEFFQLYAVQTIEYFARIAKEAAGNRLLVGSYYGYYWGHYANNPYHFQDSGNYGLKYLVKSPYIDFVGGPSVYLWRKYCAQVNGLSASLALHGKVWETEGDMRTYLTQPEDADYGTPANLAETIAFAKRNYCTEFSKKANYYFHDFVYDWYRDEVFMDVIGKLVRLDKFLRQTAPPWQPEIAVICSEETIPYLSNGQWNSLSGFARSCFEIDMFGAPFDLYTDGDLDSIDFSQYKTVIFPNSYFASDRTIDLVRSRVMKDNRTVIFFHAAGIIGKDLQPSTERFTALTGLNAEYEPGAVTANVEKYPEKTPRIVEYPAASRIVIRDDDAEVLGLYGDGKTAVARKMLSEAETIVIGHPVPNPAFLRDILNQDAKVHLYMKKQFDWLYVCGNLLGLFSREGGCKDIELPYETEVVAEIFTGEILAENTAAFTVSMPVNQPHTAMIFTGTRSQWEELAKQIQNH